MNIWRSHRRHCVTIPVFALIAQSLALSGYVAFRIGPVIVFQLSTTRQSRAWDLPTELAVKETGELQEMDFKAGCMDLDWRRMSGGGSYGRGSNVVR